MEVPEELEAQRAWLVRAHQQLELVPVEEIEQLVAAEVVGGAALFVLRPLHDVFARVGPHEVDEPVVLHRVHRQRNCLDLVEVEAGPDAAVAAEHAMVHDGADGQRVERLQELVVELAAVLLYACTVHVR